MQSGSPVSSVSWTFASVPAGGSQTVTFQVKLDSTGWTTHDEQVTNVGKVCTTEEGATCTTTPPVVVVVKLPTSSISKGVRKAGTTGAFVTQISASANDSVEYQLSYTNNGPGIAHDVVISDPIPTRTTYTSCTGGCTTTGSPVVTSVSWTFPEVGPGVTKTVTFIVKLDPNFPNGTTNITNVGKVCVREIRCKDSPPVTVTVTSEAKSNLVKKVRNVTTSTPATGFASTVDASPGDVIEYQLAYTNTGTGPATNVVISDPIPTKTTFKSCSPTCEQSGSPVSSVSWTFPRSPRAVARP